MVIRQSQLLSEEEFQLMLGSAEVLEQDAHGLKVLKLASGDILKIFRIKHLFSSARIYSYARRFCRNAERLKKLGIPTVIIKKLYHFPDSTNSAVLYEPLQGNTLRALLLAQQLDELILCELGTFIARLHKSGVYFRSLHFGNIVWTPDKQLGLIDIADISIFPWALGCRRRARNFHHVRRIGEDLKSLGAQGWDTVMACYLAHSASAGCAKMLKQRLSH